MNSGRYAAIILAGGTSSRMGNFKPLLRVGKETIIEREVSLFLQNNVQVYVVTGSQEDKLKAGIKHLNIIFVHNVNFEQGMFTSILAGLSQLRTTYKGVFILPVDIPLIRPETIRQLLKSAELHPDKIIYPVFGKERGHPPLIPPTLIPNILNWKGKGGLKNVLSTYQGSAFDVNVVDQNILFDIDTPKDYELLLDRFEHYEIPSKEECEVILSDFCAVSNQVRLHGIKVSEVAGRIAKAILKSGINVDLDIVNSAAMLHDIAKRQPKHDLAGGKMLKELGFGKIGDIVAVHSDLPENSSNLSLETKIVFLADKFVKAETIVSIEERYQSSDQRFGLTSEIETRIQTRKLRALQVKSEIEILMGQSLESVILNSN